MSAGQGQKEGRCSVLRVYLDWGETRASVWVKDRKVWGCLLCEDCENDERKRQGQGMGDIRGPCPESREKWRRQIMKRRKDDGDDRYRAT